MKKFMKRLGVGFLTLIIIMTAGFFIIKSQKLPYIDIGSINLKDLKDGSYTGEFSKGPVKAVVGVEVKNNKITNIAIKEHQNGLGKKAEKITGSIISKQSLEVDVVNGATLSSNVIRKAVELALEK